MNPLSRRTKVGCVIGLISLLVVIGLLAFRLPSGSDEGGDGSVGNLDATPRGSSPFSGTWVSDPVKRGKNVTLTVEIRFLDEDRFVLDSTSTMNGKVYPGSTDLFRYTNASESSFTATLVSKTFDGEDISKDKDRVPKEWLYRFEEDGAFRIEKPGVTGPLNYTFRRGQ